MVKRRSWMALAGAALMALSVGIAEAGPGNGGGKGRGQEQREKARGRRAVVVNGVVKSAGAGSFVVARRGGKGGGKNGLTVTVVTNEKTSYRKSDGSAASAEDVIVGVRVQVKGKKNAEGSLVAGRVMVKVVEPEEEDGE